MKKCIMTPVHQNLTTVKYNVNALLNINHLRHSVLSISKAMNATDFTINHCNIKSNKLHKTDISPFSFPLFNKSSSPHPQVNEI